MALPASDGFSTGSTKTLTAYSASWTIRSGGISVSTSNSGQAYGTSTNNAAYWHADTFPNDQYSQAVFSAVASPGTTAGVAVRVSSSANSLYRLVGDNGNTYIVKVINGIATSLVSNATGWSAGDTIRLEVSGSTLTAYKNGSTSGMPSPVTDTSLTSGYAGIAFNSYTTSAALGSWTAGSLVQTYTRSVSGAISSAGALKGQTTKALAGAVTSAGALAKGIQYSLSLIGGMNPSGALTTLKAFGRVFSGAVTSSGAVTRSTTKVLAGAVASAGALKRTATKALAGAVTSAGALAKGIQYSLSLIGGMNPSGALTTLKAFGRAFGGTVTSAGVVTRQTTKGLGGAVSSAGALKRTATKLLSGAATSSGAAALTATKVLAGAVTSAGALTLGRLYARAFSGAISSAGAVFSGKVISYIPITPLTRTLRLLVEGRAAQVLGELRDWIVGAEERHSAIDETVRSVGVGRENRKDEV